MATALTVGQMSSAAIGNYNSTHKAISDALRAVLTRTTDTGQVDFVAAAPTVLPAANTIRDYEIFRFNDALQPTAPIFLRVDYMVGSSAGNIRVDWTVGTGSDGAGAITNVHWGRSQVVATTENTTASRNCYASHGAGWAWVLWGLDPNTTDTNQGTGGFYISRSVNADGTPNDKGLQLMQISNSGGPNQWVNRIYIPPGGTQPIQPQWLAQPSSHSLPNAESTQSAVVGDVSYAFPIHPGYPIGPPVPALMACWRNDWPRLTQVSVPFYGAARNWLSLGRAVSMNVPYVTSANTTTVAPGGFLLRYE